MTKDTMTDEIDEEIDELTREVVMTIGETQDFLDDLPEFDPKYRRMEEAEEVDLF